MNLEGRAAIVTGAGVSVGRATALDLARRGVSVVVNYSRSAAEADATAADCERLGVRALSVKADVRDDDAVRAMTRAATEAFGRLDILVNNAGVTRFIDHADMEKVTPEDWSFIFDTNVWGTFVCTRAAVPALRKAGGGVVINLSSVAGVYGTGSSIPYCASKAAINNMTVTMARALAPEVRVNAVAPGFVDTRWWSDRENADAIKQFAAAAAPLKKVCQAEDVSKVIVDLVCADLVTGQIVVVDGGMGIRG
jgi:3-oxoacyl-[acyl-carrier protein] reductase